MRSILFRITLVAAGTMFGAGVVHADTDPYSYAWKDDSVQSGVGVSATVGGGVTGFTDKTMRDNTSSVGGLWDFRATIGSRVPIGLDVSYVGTAADIHPLISAQSGTLVGTTVEAALRYNILPHNTLNPYIFAGMGWQHYDVTSANFTLSDAGIASSDDLLEFPMGAGVQYRVAGFLADVRGTFRATTDNNLVLTAPGFATSNFASMHTWEASAALGYEF
jgi:hypothetical protein